MIHRPQDIDWNDAYANGAHIPAAETFPPRWVAEAQAFRKRLASDGRSEIDRAYGDEPREKLDLFYPTDKPAGLAVFVHGGFWKAFDKSSWSHLAAGPLAHGWAVGLPSYTLCPDASISQITRQIGAAIGCAADIVSGPICLAGHSAGGHLVSRMNCTDGPLGDAVRDRLRHTISISGLHDLRPLMKTGMNEIFGLDLAEARTESAALCEPLDHARLTCWVGANERPEFLRQNELLVQMWTGLAAGISSVIEPDKHHFDVIESLAEPKGALTTALLSEHA